MIKKPLISIVMPIYGVEQYLRDALESVVRQDIGFEDNIELILVNDGSPDNSEAICLEYKERYPENVVYIRQKNQGLSATRYNGFLKARGKYIHSMDSDDTISPNFYRKSVEFLEENGDKVDFVASKLIFFEARKGDHYLNYRLKTTRVIDVTKEPDALHYHIASIVIKRSAVKTEWFDKKISIGEDARLVSMILASKKAYGVVSDIAYNYRIREAGTSLINTQHLKRDYYTETPTRFWAHVLDFWQDKEGKLPKYIQNLVLNDMQWRINEQRTQSVLSPEEETQYKQVIYDIITRLDDDVIMGCDRLPLYRRIFLMRKKYEDFQARATFNSKRNAYYLDNVKLVELGNDHYFGLVLDFIKPLGGDTYLLEGYPTNDTLNEGDKLKIRTSRGVYELTPRSRAQRTKDSFLGDQFRINEAFDVTIEASSQDDIIAELHAHTGEVRQVLLATKRNTRIGTINTSYRQMGDVFLRKEGIKIATYPVTKMRRIIFETRFELGILKNLRIKKAISLLKEGLALYREQGGAKLGLVTVLRPPVFVLRNAVLNIQSLFLRWLFFAGLYRSDKPVWLISDRGIGGGDNGEAFFKYVMSLKKLTRDPYFVLSKSSKDYKRMKKIGPVLALESLRYKIIFLRSSKVISSQADEYVINPFGAREPHFVDLLHFDFVFLQHGVTKNDISDWLNRFFKDIKLFVTVGQREYQSILDYPFYYSEKEVGLLGFPRYDLLDNTPKNKIILAPTWRKYLTNGAVKKDGSWQYQSDFKESDYFNFYNNLMNDSRLLDAMREAGVTGEFYLHPSHSNQTIDYQGNDVFTIMSFPYDYKRALGEGSLLITDYSSVYFDFSYLRKPVIYSQFDRDYYFKNHGVYDRGYFEEARDGFGPVTEDYESTVDEIIRFIKARFSMDEKYRKRVDAFFEYNDKNSSRRVYEAIWSLDEK